MREVVIVSAARTALGSFGGSLASVPAVELGAVAIRAALSRGGVDAGMVEEVVMGNVLQAGLGQNPARQAAVKAGIPVEIPAWTVNKVCGSGLKAVAEAALAIRAGEAAVWWQAAWRTCLRLPMSCPPHAGGAAWAMSSLWTR